ncbi:amidohydrolase family protein [Metaclostridioides mangenotii]|uniref:Cytosine/adenosine deaminase-related metal-dependent hydrolase n=1 Tax=Metaclostridioides mangenotii TaxID=1540 RepID=A0ABS4EC15_9FIRM|nr:amidohydrolase family protein [Clostridioides mangenotii]MBP1855474.1 cytosine/adenosine deaminase-related metal-dependent hydrolase [Clostridioides mangenotii]
MSWIKNVLVETSLEEVSQNNIITKTEQVCLLVQDGIIKEITDVLPNDAEDVVDAKGYLAVPSLSDNHIHLDKGHYGGKWHAVVPMNSVAERIVEERGFLQDFLVDTPQKAQALIDLITSKGATYLKVQVNVDPVIGLDNLDVIKKVLKKNIHKLDYEIVIFPQHGLLDTEKLGLLSKALEDNAVTVLGALDPATIDGDIEKSLKTTFDLAMKYQKEVDIHLHDQGSLGIYEINRIIDYTLESNMQGKVQISHALALADIFGDELENIINRLKEADIVINTTVPIDTKALSIPALRKHGIKVNVVNDNINDHWSPFGTGDLIQRASRAAEVFSLTDEVSLSSVLGLVTNGVTPLDTKGKKVWPKVGDKANILFAKAESSAHLIGRVCEDRVVLFKGKFVSGEFK